MSRRNKSGKVHDKKGYGGEFYSGERKVKKGGVLHVDNFAFQNDSLIDLVGKKVFVMVNHVHNNVRNYAITVYPTNSRDYINRICNISVQYEIEDLKNKPSGYRWSKNNTTT